MTNPTPPLKISPCPFCGLPGKLHQWPVPKIGRDDNWEAWSVECTAPKPHNCPSGRHYLSRSADEALRAWNQRVDSQEKVTIVDRVVLHRSLPLKISDTAIRVAKREAIDGEHDYGYHVQLAMNAHAAEACKPLVEMLERIALSHHPKQVNCEVAWQEVAGLAAATLAAHRLAHGSPEEASP